jgi:hypothetical protein
MSSRTSLKQKSTINWLTDNFIHSVILDCQTRNDYKFFISKPLSNYSLNRYQKTISNFQQQCRGMPLSSRSCFQGSGGLFDVNLRMYSIILTLSASTLFSHRARTMEWFAWTVDTVTGVHGLLHYAIAFGL